MAFFAALRHEVDKISRFYAEQEALCATQVIDAQAVCAPFEVRS